MQISPATRAFCTVVAQTPVQHFTVLFLIFILDPQHPIRKGFIVIIMLQLCGFALVYAYCIWINVHKLIGCVKHHREAQTSYLHPGTILYLVTSHSLFVCDISTCIGALFLSGFCLHHGPYCSSSPLYLQNKAVASFVFRVLPVRFVALHHV